MSGPLVRPAPQSTEALGLTEAEATLRRAGRPAGRPAATRSYASILRANVLTVFNLVLAGFGAVTLAFGDARDALFLGVILANATIGITQEVRAKRALDRLSLLVAPRATVLRDGVARSIAVDQLVVGDLIALNPGDQVVADARLLSAQELSLDESALTGESEAVARAVGEPVRSGSFVLEGGGRARVEAVGADSFAAKLTGEARSFRHPRSPLERSVNRLLYALVALVLLLGAVLGYSLYHRHVGVRTAVSTATAGVVTLVPEGLMVLVSLTYAAAAVRMSRRGVLAQQLNAIESLASVDTLCIDKTGTLTEPQLRVVETIPTTPEGAAALEAALRGLTALSPVRNVTLEAIARRFPTEPGVATASVPFSSRRRWSAVEGGSGVHFLGAPERLPTGGLTDVAARRQEEGRRVLAVAAGRAGLAGYEEDDPPGDLLPLGLVVLAEELRPGIRETIAFLRAEGVEIKVLSGDSPRTVAAIARDVGIEVGRVADGAAIPVEEQALRQFAARTTVVGRISPDGKRAIVRALRDSGRYVAMVGDGVNDVPALKSSRLAIAQGSGTQMARAVSDLVLINGDFASLPVLVDEGRRALRNLQRVTKLYVTKSAFAAFLILTIGTTSDAYPLLPRHLSLAASLTIGIPTFVLALAPSSGGWRPERFGRTVARFAVPAGFVTGSGVVAGYLFALHDLGQTVVDARTVAVSILVVTGLYLVLALEAGGSALRARSVLVMCVLMAALYLATLLLPATREFFQLGRFNVAMLATSVLASAVSMTALALCGFTVSVGLRRRGDAARR